MLVHMPVPLFAFPFPVSRLFRVPVLYTNVVFLFVFPFALLLLYTSTLGYEFQFIKPRIQPIIALGRVRPACLAAPDTCYSLRVRYGEWTNHERVPGTCPDSPPIGAKKLPST
ncbi:hypothetical protein QBC45DRAFT_401753 [Copromyces sp. CBS 386.78]|nr:hypothetical protein QBC45DRAFT_401753 [Copromyces sp. CBS 386.78]